MIKVEQLAVTDENIGMALFDDGVYLVRFKEENKVKLNLLKGYKEVMTLPAKASLISLKGLTTKELRKIIKEEEVAIVKITVGES